MRALLFLLTTGCTSEVTFGDVQAIDHGDGRLRLNACLDEDFLLCKREDVVLTAMRGAASTELHYGGFIFARHQGSMPLEGDGPVVVSDGDSAVVMELPPAFDLTSSFVDDKLSLAWRAADEAMIWTANYRCPPAGQPLVTQGASVGDETDDDGKLEITVAELRELLEVDATTSCRVTIEVSRVRTGLVDDDFPADDATGIARRTAEVVF
jgi:hypothetical protein